MSHDELLAEYERIKARAAALEREANRLQQEKGRLAGEAEGGGGVQVLARRSSASRKPMRDLGAADAGGRRGWERQLTACREFSPEAGVAAACFPELIADDKIFLMGDQTCVRRSISGVAEVYTCNEDGTPK